MRRYQNPYGAFETDMGNGMSALAKAMFSGSPYLNEQRKERADYYKALTAKTGIEADRAAAAQGARGRIAGIFMDLPKQMAARRAPVEDPGVAGPARVIAANAAQDTRNAATEFVDTAPSRIAAAAAGLPSSEQAHLPATYRFVVANQGTPSGNPAYDDSAVARAVVGAGRPIGKDQAVSIADREGVAARDQAGHMEIEGVRSADRRYAADRRGEASEYGTDVRADTNRYGIDQRANTARYGVDTRAATATRGQDVRAATSARSQDITAETQRRGQDIYSEDRQRGQEITAETQRRGQDVGAETQRRGQDIRADTTERGQDIASADRQSAQAAKTKTTANQVPKITPAEYQRYKKTLSDIAGTEFTPEAEEKIIGRAAELFQTNKDAINSTRQALQEFQPQLERKDSSLNPFSKKQQGLAEKVVGPAPVASAPAAASAPTTIAIPPADQRVPGQTYPTPKGDMIWTGRSWVEPKDWAPQTGG